MEKNQVYRAGVGAFIINDNFEFLMIQNQGFRDDEWDFVKGGMKEDETLEETLNREIKEELGSEFNFTILEKSNSYIIYDWPESMQKTKGYRGQARVSFWVKYNSGKIIPAENEVTNYQWVSEPNVKEFLVKSGCPKDFVEILIFEWEKVKSRILAVK
jgi:8-oxo-dGTP pyrophosphatase MutT (NUDIX family)